VRLPPVSELRTAAARGAGLRLADFTRRVIGAVQRGGDSADELVFDSVNVWVPRGPKRLVFLPIERGLGLHYPLRTKDADGLAACAHDLQASSEGVSVIFHGQSVFHQALVGPEFSHEGGSLEGRYLTLSLASRTHAGALRVEIGRVDGEGDDEESFLGALFG
jgi:hypothetical protein